MRTPRLGRRTRQPRKKALSFLGCAALLLSAHASVSTADAQKSESPHRKVVQRYEPDYPRILKNAHIGGLVRLNVTVLANGDVAKVETLGGSPIFADSASKAVMRWRYSPASSQTSEEVEIHFNPD